jgi:hypothetical protein
MISKRIVRGARLGALEAGTTYALVIEMQFPSEEERAAIRFGISPPVSGDPIADAVAAARDAAAAVVIVGTDGAWETEGSDRVDMRLPGRQDELIAAVAGGEPPHGRGAQHGEPGGDAVARRCRRCRAGVVRRPGVR